MDSISRLIGKIPILSIEYKIPLECVKWEQIHRSADKPPSYAETAKNSEAATGGVIAPLLRKGLDFENGL